MAKERVYTYEALCEAEDGDISDTMQDSILFHSGAITMNPVEDEVMSKLEVNKKKSVLNEICDWVFRDREVAIFVMFYFLEMTYKEIAEKLELPDGIKEAKKFKMRGCNERLIYLMVVKAWQVFFATLFR